jgi:hypothetical protein
MFTVTQRLGGALFALSLCSAASAITVYDNGPPNLVSGTGMSEVLVAENFSFGSSFDVTNLRFWSIQDTAAAYKGSVYWAIYSNNAGQPGTLLNGGVTAAVTGTATGGSTGFGYPAFVYNIPVSFTLPAGSYWLGLHNGALANTTPSEMLWATTTTQIGSFGLYKDGVNWISSLNEHAFLIEGVATQVPEPTTLALLLAGLVGTVSIARRRASV